MGTYVLVSRRVPAVCSAGFVIVMVVSVWRRVDALVDAIREA